MAELSEAEARRKLIEHGANTAASKEYEAHRITGGWAFYRLRDLGAGRYGDLPYVVADNGKAAPQSLDQSEADIIRMLEKARRTMV